MNPHAWARACEASQRRASKRRKEPAKSWLAPLVLAAACIGIGVTAFIYLLEAST